MVIEHRGKRPSIADSAYVAPNALVSGDVTIEEDARVLFGAVLTAEGGPVEIGDATIIMEQAVVRGRERHRTRIGRHSIVGPHAHVNGAVVEDYAFLATGSSAFVGARVGAGAEVRVNGVVYVDSSLPAEAVVPIGWVAVGDPVEILPPDDHERIWSIQRGLDFPGTVFGLPRLPPGELMEKATAQYAEAFGRHQEDLVLRDRPSVERISLVAAGSRSSATAAPSAPARSSSSPGLLQPTPTANSSARATPTSRPAKR